MKLSTEKLLEELRELPRPLGPEPGGRKLGAVLAVFSDGPAGPELLFTKRAANLAEHAGQISFPGGAVEDGDPSFQAAALREAEEEVGLAPSELTLLSALPTQPVRDAWLMYPFAAFWPRPRPLRPAPGEVADLIVWPVADLLRQHRAGCRLVADPALSCRYDLGGEVLWGATARVVGRLLDYLFVSQKFKNMLY